MFSRIKKLAERFKNSIRRPLDDDDREALHDLGLILFRAAMDGEISDEEKAHIIDSVKNLKTARRNTP